MGLGATIFALWLDKSCHGARITQHGDTGEDLDTV
jgi:hypothetical protein